MHSSPLSIHNVCAIENGCRKVVIILYYDGSPTFWPLSLFRMARSGWLIFNGDSKWRLYFCYCAVLTDWIDLLFYVSINLNSRRCMFVFDIYILQCKIYLHKIYIQTHQINNRTQLGNGNITWKRIYSEDGIIIYLLHQWIIFSFSVIGDDEESICFSEERWMREKTI